MLRDRRILPSNFLLLFYVYLWYLFIPYILASFSISFLDYLFYMFSHLIFFATLFSSRLDQPVILIGRGLIRRLPIRTSWEVYFLDQLDSLGP
jgi:hypothetical protein